MLKNVQYPLFLSILTKFALQIFEKYANIKFNETTSNGSRVVPCGQTDMTNLTVVFAILGTPPKKGIFSVFTDPRA